MGFMAVALAGTLGAAIGLRLGGAPYFGVMFAQYTGALLLTGALVAIGLWASSLTRNQITAFIAALTVIFVLMAITMNVVLIGLPPVLAVAATRLGLLTHFAAITRGVLDLRDLVYFASITVAFLGLAYLMIERGRLNLKGRSWRTLRIGILGILLICVVVNLLGRHIRGRIDLTPGKTYTLSSTTRAVLENLDDVVTLKFFASRELPPQVELVRRDVEDLLSDYAATAGDNLQLLRFSPSADDPEGLAEAEQMEIPAIQFNVLGQDEFQVRQGYLGISIQYADQTANVPFVRQTDDLEYRLTSAILALTNPARTTLGFLTGHGEADIGGAASGLAETLGQSYDVRPVDITAAGAEVPDAVRVLIVQGPETPLSESEGEALRAFLARGGNMLLMVQPLSIDETQAFPNPQPHPVLDGLLAEYGVAVPDGMVIDHRSSGRVTLSSSGAGYVVPYPLWPIVVPASAHAMVEGLTGVLLPWSSPLDLSRADTTTVTPLLATTEFGQHLTGPHPLNPQFDWNSIAANLRPQPMAAAILPRTSGGADTEDRGISGWEARAGGRRGLRVEPVRRRRGRQHRISHERRGLARAGRIADSDPGQASQCATPSLFVRADEGPGEVRKPDRRSAPVRIDRRVEAGQTETTADQRVQGRGSGCVKSRQIKAIFAALSLLLVAYVAVRLLSGDGRAPGSDSITASVRDGFSVVRVLTPDAADSVRLEEADGGWTVNGYPADSSLVRQLAEGLDSARVGRLVARSATNHARLGVSDDSARRIEIGPIGDPGAMFLLGRGGTDGRFVRFPPSDDVFADTRRFRAPAGTVSRRMARSRGGRRGHIDLDPDSDPTKRSAGTRSSRENRRE